MQNLHDLFSNPLRPSPSLYRQPVLSNYSPKMSLVASSTVADIKTIPLYAAGALAVFFLLLIRVERRLSAYPGPFLAKFTDWWKVYHLHKRDYPETLRRWHEKHGPIIRIGPNHLSIGDPNEVVKVYRTSPVLNKVRDMFSD